MIPGFDTWGVVGVLCGLLALTAVRSLSEVPVPKLGRVRDWLERKWSMVESDKSAKPANTNDKSRSLFQFFLETVWAVGAGVMAAHWPP